MDYIISLFIIKRMCKVKSSTMRSIYCGSQCVPVAQWLENCISKRKGCGFDSQGTHILTIQMYSLNAL